jgi:hypothetical protein
MMMNAAIKELGHDQAGHIAGLIARVAGQRASHDLF